MNILGIFDIVVSVLFNLAVFAFSAYSLFKIGRQNGVKNSWLAFVPILQYYIIGSICEEYELFGRRFRHLEWILCGLYLIQTLFPSLRYFSIIFYMASPVIRIAANLLIAVVLHKFFYLFDNRRALIYAIIGALGKLPLSIILFIIRDKPMEMSAGAYPYPFANRL